MLNLKNNNFIGVGGLVVKDNKYLMVKHTYGEYKGKWIIPGGHLEPGEHLNHAAEREVLEESGITAKAGKILSVRSRVRGESTTDCYIIFEMEWIKGEPVPSCGEVDDARFFSYEEVDALKNIVSLAKLIITKYEKGMVTGLNQDFTPPYIQGNNTSKLFL